MTRESFQYVQFLGHSMATLPPALMQASAAISKLRHRLLNTRLCWRILLRVLGPRYQFMCWYGEPPTHGIEPNNKVDDKYTLTPKLWEYLYNYAAKHKAKGNGFGYGMVKRNSNDVTRTLSARYYKDGSEVLINQDDMKRNKKKNFKNLNKLLF